MRATSASAPASRGGPDIVGFVPFKKILVPIDFEPASEETVNAGTAIQAGEHYVEFAPASLQSMTMAADLARASGGSIVLLHVTPPMHSTAMYTGPVSLPAGIISEIESKAKATSLAALEHLAQSNCRGIPVEHAIGPGHPAQTIVDEARRVGADLIVMAASGRSRVARFFVGSTTDRVVREASCPVLVVPAG